MIDPYRILGLPIDASAEDVHAAYRELARRYHPDRNAGREASARMVELNEAYSWLKDDGRRRSYDRRFVVREPEPFHRLVIEAALDAIRSSGTPFEEPEDGLLLLEPSGSRTGVLRVGVLGDVELDQVVGQISRWEATRDLGFAVVLAYRVVAPGNIAGRWDGVGPGGVIELARSEWFGEGPVPCPTALGKFVIP
jgi:curved DNA-binding protein CbpA